MAFGRCRPVCGAVFLLFAADARGQCATQVAKLSPADGVGDAQFGYGVALHGEWAVVGAPFDSQIGYSVGAAYVFHRDASGWSEYQKLVPSDSGEFLYFGTSVATDGASIVVGAPSAPDDVLMAVGAAYVYELADEGWTQQMKVVAPDGAVGDSFGTAVAVAAGRLAVGASRDDHGELTDAGSAYVFESDGRIWEFQQKLIAYDGAAHDEFGRDIDVFDSTVVVGAPYVGPSVGAVYVFSQSGLTWTQDSVLQPTVSASGSQFGLSVSVDPPFILAAAPGNDAVFSFQWDGSAWQPGQTLFPANDASEFSFGTSVDVDGNVAVVGSQGYGNYNAGAASVFRYSNRLWSQQQELTGSDSVAVVSLARRQPSRTS